MRDNPTQSLEKRSLLHRKTTPKNIILEIQGLRAIALPLVVIYHIWFNKVSGGVDVFFVISAFLITTTLYKKPRNTIQSITHLTNIIKKLLPVASVVILSTIISTTIIFKETLWKEVFQQAKASIFYYQNWFLITQETNYYSPNSETTSPLQHFWSLSIQLQIFTIWIAIFLVIRKILYFINKKKPLIPEKQTLITIFSTIFIVSLTLSIINTAQNPNIAYFETQNRLWEFALGSLIALLLPHIKIKKILKIILGWTGLATIVLLGIFIGNETQFPGYIALIPTLATAAVIISSKTESKYSAARLLGAKPLLKLAKISYGIYLWHWPILIFFIYQNNNNNPNFIEGIAIIVATLILATITFHIIEKPIQQKTLKIQQNNSTKFIEKILPITIYTTISALSIATVLLPIKWWNYGQNTNTLNIDFNENIDTDLDTKIINSNLNKNIKNQLQNIDEEWFPNTYNCSNNIKIPQTPPELECHIIHNPAYFTKTILVVGNSHMQQWNAALESIAQNNNWRLLSTTKSSCMIQEYPEILDDIDQNCLIWNTKTLEYLPALKPDYVILLGSKMSDQGLETGFPTEYISPGFENQIDKILKQGIEVLALRGHPRMHIALNECLIDYGITHYLCNIPITSLVPERSPLEDIALEKEKFYFLDTSTIVCEHICSPISNNTLTYIDNIHLSKTFIISLTSKLENLVQLSTPWIVEPDYTNNNTYIDNITIYAHDNLEIQQP